MRCKTCQYVLWNLRSRECPECGTPFRPSEFEFIPNAVRFCCPHCAQEYYGTDAKGHLVPAEFVCVSCNRPVVMDECVLLPTEGVQEDKALADTFPWLERPRLGLLKAWLKTVGWSLVLPGRLGATIPSGAPLGIAYAAGTFVLVSLLGASVVLLAMLVPALAAGGGTMGFFGAFAAFLVVPPLALLAYLSLWILSAHLVIVVRNPRQPALRRTCQALAFSAGTLLPSCVPCIGFYILPVAGIWWLVSAGIMLRRMHGVSAMRAAFAVLALPLLLIVIGAASFLSLWYTNLRPGTSASVITLPPSPPATRSDATASARQVSQALRGFRSLHRRWPEHPHELVRNALLRQQDLCAMTPRSDLPVHRFDRPVAAMRCADVVFCYFGLEGDIDPANWLFIYAPDPDAAASPGTAQAYIVGLGDSSVVSYDPEEFTQALRDQNARRAVLNLPPLPDPSEVTAARPVFMPE
jgi:hypothetical protein